MSNHLRPSSETSPSISTPSMSVSGQKWPMARATVPPALPRIATLRGGSPPRATAGRAIMSSQ